MCAQKARVIEVSRTALSAGHAQASTWPGRRAWQNRHDPSAPVACSWCSSWPAAQQLTCGQMMSRMQAAFPKCTIGGGLSQSATILPTLCQSEAYHVVLAPQDLEYEAEPPPTNTSSLRPPRSRGGWTSRCMHTVPLELLCIPIALSSEVLIP